MGRPPLRDGRLTTARAGITQPDRRRSPGKRPAASMARTRRSLTPRWRAASATSSISLTSTTIPHAEQLCLRDYGATTASHIGYLTAPPLTTTKAYDEAADPALTSGTPINWEMGVQPVGNGTRRTFVDGVSGFRRKPQSGLSTKVPDQQECGSREPHSPPRARSFPTSATFPQVRDLLSCPSLPGARGLLWGYRSAAAVNADCSSHCT